MNTNTPPLPGAQHNPFLTVSMAIKTYSAPGVFSLRAQDAANYTAGDPAKPFSLKEGDSLYRVYGGLAGEQGGYWSPQPPVAGETEGEWRSKNAVLGKWNTGQHVAQMTVNDGNVLQSWKGGIEAQAVVLKGQTTPVPGWFLVGGGTQYLCPFFDSSNKKLVTFKALGNTPWNTTGAEETLSLSEETQCTVAPADLDAANAAHAHVAETVALAQALRKTSHSLADTNTDMQSATRIGLAANEVMEDANALVANIDSNHDAATHIARSQLTLSRYIDLDPTWPGAQDAQAKLTDVVFSAARFGATA